MIKYRKEWLDCGEEENMNMFCSPLVKKKHLGPIMNHKILNVHENWAIVERIFPFLPCLALLTDRTCPTRIEENATGWSVDGQGRSLLLSVAAIDSHSFGPFQRTFFFSHTLSYPLHQHNVTTRTTHCCQTTDRIAAWVINTFHWHGQPLMGLPFKMHVQCPQRKRPTSGTTLLNVFAG